MVEVHEARKHPEPTRFCPTHVLVDDVHFALNQSLLEVEFPFLYNHNAGSLVQHPWYYIYYRVVWAVRVESGSFFCWHNGSAAMSLGIFAAGALEYLRHRAR